MRKIYDVLCIFFALMSLALCSVPALQAAPPAVDVPSAGDRLLRQNEERQRLFEKRNQAPLRTPPDEIPLPELPLTSPEAADGCVQVERLKITGATLLPARFLRGLHRDYEHRCLTLADIDNIVRRITNAYTAMGLVTSRALLEPQDLSSGTLNILIVEGVLEDVRPAPESGIDPRQLRVIFPGMRGRPLNLRDVEQGLDQMNRLASRNATMRIEPGENYGGSIVVVDDKPDKSWRFSMGADNTGQTANGEYLHTISLDKDNLLGCFDQLSVACTFDAPHYAAHVNRDASGHNFGFNAYLSIPYGPWTWFASLNRFTYSTRIEGMARQYVSSGDSAMLKLGADRVIHRDGSGKTSLGAALAVHDVDNFMEGLRMASSSYYLTVVSVNATHTRRIAGGSLSVRLEPGLGVSALGAQRDKNHIPRAVPRRQYRSFNASVQWYRPLQLARQSFVWDSSFSCQFANRTLYGAQRFSLGSLYTVRGFLGSPLDGDQGALLRNTLAWNVPLTLPDQSWLRGVQLYAGYDWGCIRRDPEDPYEHGRMQGMAFGARTSGRLRLDCCYAKPLSAPAFIRKKPGVFTATLSVTF